jgi:hypothetical protein
MKDLVVFDGVPIPVDYASTQTYALLAKRDGGKTYTTLKIEEQMCDAGLFFVTLDPVGKHWALRAGKNGSERGGKRDVWVLGGNHGDVPLEPTSGELIADTVIAHPGRYVLDVSTFDTDAEQDRFALAFGQRLFRRKAKDPGFPLLLILEEAESFIPQAPQSGQQRMLGVYGKIMRQGRNYGLGMLVVAQRAQALNKGVLSQAEVLIVKQMSHNRDIDAVDEWTKANGTPEQRAELLSSVASLEQNEAYVWSPSWLRVFKRTVVLPRDTFDSSASVKGGQEAKSVKLVPLDVDALGAQIRTAADRAKSEDPKELRKEIARLKRELEQRPTEKQVEMVTETVEVPVLANGAVDRLEEAVKAIAAAAGRLGDATGEISGELRRIAVGRPTAPSLPRRPAVQEPRPPRVPAARRAAQPDTDDGDVQLRKGERKMLTVLAQRHPMVVTRAQLGTLAGFAPRGGTFGTYLGTLKRAGLIIEEHGEIRVTQDGLDHLGEIPESPQTTEELLAMWRGALRAGERTMLDILVEAYPEGLTREDLGEAAGYASSGGTFGTYLGTLRRNGLIEVDGPVVQASASLFLEAV